MSETEKTDDGKAMSAARALPLHEEVSVRLDASASEAFAYLDDHRGFSSHMNRSSWRTGGARMETVLDEKHGQAVGSTIRIVGRALGLSIHVKEVVTKRVAPTHKEWSTIGTPRLLVIGHYRMGFAVAEEAEHSTLRIYIDFEPSSSAILRPVARALARAYARWCVVQMALDAQRWSRRSERHQRS